MEKIINKEKTDLLFESYYKLDYKEFCRLLDSGACANRLDKHGRSLISLVTRECRFARINKKFFDKLMSCDIDIKDINKNHGLLSCSILYQSDIHYMKELIKSGASVDFCSLSPVGYDGYCRYYGPPMFHALDVKDIEKINLLLKSGIDIESCDESDQTLLNYLIINSSSNFLAKTLPLFIEYGAFIEQRGTNGATALHWLSSKSGNEKLFDLFFEKNININIKDTEGKSPLIYAAYSGNKKSANILIKNGANLNIQDCNGNTAAMTAASYGELELLKILHKSGADLSLTNNFGENVAHFIAMEISGFKTQRVNNNYLNILKKNPKLLSVKNYNGCTPLDILKNHDNEFYSKVDNNSYYLNYIKPFEKDLDCLSH